MFSGIIEAEGEVIALKREKDNIHFFIRAPFTPELKVDQSVSHNGVCLTVTDIEDGVYSVTAIKETLLRSNLGKLKKGDKVNLERCVRIGDRLDGHIVQGHVDCTAACTAVKKEKGSWLFSFACDKKSRNARFLLVEKGSVCVNGVSLTVVRCNEGAFSVAIIPYTFSHTNFRDIRPGTIVNVEFDIIGKYVVNMLK